VFITSNIWQAILATPKRIQDSWVDPVRRKHSISRILETLIPVAIITRSWWMPIVIVVGEWMLYEWILEPIGWSGPYWERGPADGETFTRW
jgi:hypothetical protein